MLYGANKYQPITIKLKNPINIARPDEVIVLPISSVKVVLGNFDENFLTIRDRGKILPYEIIKNDGGDNIIFQVSFHPFEMKKITLSWSKNKPNVKAGRTQAYLAVKKNYNYSKLFLFGSYANGNFNENSDIDIAVVFDDYSDKGEMLLNLMLTPVERGDLILYPRIKGIEIQEENELTV